MSCVSSWLTSPSSFSIKCYNTVDRLGRTQFWSSASITQLPHDGILRPGSPTIALLSILLGTEWAFEGGQGSGGGRGHPKIWITLWLWMHGFLWCLGLASIANFWRCEILAASDVEVDSLSIYCNADSIMNSPGDILTDDWLCFAYFFLRCFFVAILSDDRLPCAMIAITYLHHFLSWRELRIMELCLISQR